ncbi:MAG: thiamine pyrophosphate-binding protein [SAR202 cluster bacterium]|nr:thiamine pyrophosphate-binding protein [SAR202 cluster bacterium]
MVRMKGSRALMEQLKAEGVKYIFGNPGTSESAIMDELERYPELKYVLVTQEGVAMGAADAYARATGKPAFVNLHIETGLANGISLLHNANEGGTPLVLTSGNKDMRKLVEGRTELKEMVTLFTKWSVELSHPEQVPGAIRRAFNEAKTPPTGPVYVGFSANAMDGEAEVEIVPSPKGHYHIQPDPQAVAEATKLLAKASNPILLVGDRIAQSNASKEAVRLAEVLGARVYAASFSEFNFPTGHPQFLGRLAYGFPDPNKLLSTADVLLGVGNVFTSYWFFDTQGGRTLAKSTKIVHVDASGRVVGKSEPTDVGMIADPKMALAALADALEAEMSGSAKEAAKGRIAAMAKEKAAQVAAWDKRLKDRWDLKPMSTERMMAEVAANIPPETVIVDDSVTTRNSVFGAIEFDRPGSVFGERGGAIGWGVGGGIGAKLANPDKPVIAIVGDGSAMMTVQGFWTAANENIPIVYLMCNNRTYRVLKLNMNVYKNMILKDGKPSKYMAMDFPTGLNLAGMAQAMGVYSRRIENPQDIGPELKKALASDKPAVLDISIDGAL